VRVIVLGGNGSGEGREGDKGRQLTSS